MWLFGKKDSKNKGAKPTPPKPKVQITDAIKQQKEVVGQLEKKQQFLEKKIELCEQEAKTKAAKKDKRGALQALKKKQLLNAQIESISNQIITLETQAMNMENVATNAAAVDALRVGVDVQKRMNTELNIDKVDDLMDDMAEAQDTMNEVNSIFATSADAVGADADLEGELEALEAQMLEEELLGTTAAPTAAPAAVPAAPTPAKVPSAAEPSTAKPEAPAASGLTADEEEQLKMLQGELEFA